MGRGRAGKPMVPTARWVAGRVLERVLRDQAFAAAALDAELERAVQLSPRDRRLATELVYGSLRVRGLLEQRLARFAPRGLGSVEPATRAHLLVAGYQLLVLEKIPVFAAVSEAVDAVRAVRGEGLARFANALLRKLAADVDKNGRVALADAVVGSMDPWLLERFAVSLGSQQQATAYAAAGPFPPPACIRLRAGEVREQWLQQLREKCPDAQLEPGSASPYCITLQGAGAVQRLPGHGQSWLVQEEGSQVVGLALGTRPGERVLDACAGRGNKTTLLVELAQQGQVVAADLYEAKLRTLRAQVEAFGGRLAGAHAVDWAAGHGEVPEGFDRVLVDAPCSGTGTIRRRPDLLGRDLKGALPGLQQLQVAILARAASRCRPGGRVVYSVCSVLREEAEEVVERVLEQSRWLRPAPFEAPELGALVGEGSQVRLLPQVHGTDGYFIASLRRED